MHYDLNMEKIEEQLHFLQRCYAVCAVKEKLIETEESFFAISRAIHLAVECMIDVGTVMIDGFIMRDPGGYLDIVDILEDEQVLTADVATVLRDWVKIRDRLVRSYTKVEYTDCLPYLEQVDTLKRFDQQVRDYISREA
ncbi:Uncharacterized conserved protein YutE, UPF0331/DUF86 family [Seinonella peptonophila]|uniref:Uncharacterized conserved protein YutE, UPF0331/DUF86 family n=1 Tax=Seinonella peptonophila TaxID=112248 RepID=A0A1M4WK93_9BACL|nr:HepT-like ribonuclease domain-containing protein [Seinonella peptonophila]SHE81721.1 Uncharacterized conserved protein YutE, UPF0331/DUF86 family [Seinonella peptonophila]